MTALMIRLGGPARRSKLYQPLVERRSGTSHTMRLPHPLFSFVALGLLAAACSGSAAERPNVLFISIDDLRNDLGALGAAHAKTPQLDAFAKTARVFTHHYVQVPTCGASRCALWRGRYPSVSAQVGNNGIKQTQQEWGARSLPAVFRAAGYRTLALGKLTHYPGGLSGRGWAEGPEELPGAWDRAWIPDGPWKNPEAIMHGYGEHAIWGKHCLYEHALRSPLMLRHPGLAQPGRASDAVVETVDVFPTLAELCGLPAPADLDGRSLRAQLNDPGAPAAKSAHGFWTGGQRTIRTSHWRLIAHPAEDATAPQVELFDYETDPDETRNHAAAHPGVVADLLTQLKPAPQR